jgi:hypothetical protein
VADKLTLLNVLWILSIGLNVVLLRRGRWERLTHLADFVLTAFGGFIRRGHYGAFGLLFLYPNVEFSTFCVQL